MPNGFFSFLFFFLRSVHHAISRELVAWIAGKPFPPEDLRWKTPPVYVHKYIHT